MGATEYTAQAEEMWTWRLFAGKLYLPHMDLRGFGDPASGAYSVNDNGSWSTVVVDNPCPTHVFDLAVTAAGTFLFGSVEAPGSESGAGTIWLDGTESLSVPGTGFARFYVACQFGDEIIAVFADNDTDVAAYHWDGATWTLVGDPATVGATSQVNDNLAACTVDGVNLWLCARHGKDAGLVQPTVPLVVSLPADQAAAAAFLASLPFTHVLDAAAGTRLWVLGATSALGTRHMYSSDTAGAWTDHGAVSGPPVSLALDEAGGYLYFGTTDSRILRTPIPA